MTMESSAFDDVLGKCIEGRASDREQRQLVEAARSSAELDARLRRAAVMDASLRALGKDGDGFFRAVQARLTRKGGSAKFSSQMRQRLERAARPPARSPFVRIVLPLAALLLLAVGLGWSVLQSRREAAADALATVVSLRGQPTASIAGQSVALAVGMGLSSGDAVHTGASGGIVMGYRDGTRVAARGNADLSVEEASQGKRLGLRAGSLMAQVAKQSSSAPMVISAPMAEATVVGTQFGLAHGRKGSLLQVIEGTVRYRRLADGATLDVTAGQNVLASPDLPFAVRPNRVQDSVKALYLFDEMSGTVVHDVSGIGTPMDLTIGDPTIATWTPDGLNDGRGHAGIRYSGPADKLTDAIGASKGMTIEFWSTARGKTSAPQVTTIRLSSPSFQSSSWMDTAKRGQTLEHVALVFTHQGDHLILTSYGGGPASIKDLGSISDAWAQMVRARSINIDVSPDVPPDDATLTNEYHMLALHGRALSAEEVRQNELAGIPTTAPFRTIDE
jgi:hypothetical protein